MYFNVHSKADVSQLNPQHGDILFLFHRLFQHLCNTRSEISWIFKHPEPPRPSYVADIAGRLFDGRCVEWIENSEPERLKFRRIREFLDIFKIR